MSKWVYRYHLLIAIKVFKENEFWDLWSNLMEQVMKKDFTDGYET